MHESTITVATGGDNNGGDSNDTVDTDAILWHEAAVAGLADVDIVEAIRDAVAGNPLSPSATLALSNLAGDLESGRVSLLHNVIEEDDAPF